MGEKEEDREGGGGGSGGREAERWCVGKRHGSTHTADIIPWVKSWNMTVSFLFHKIIFASFSFSACVVQRLICVCVNVTGGMFDAKIFFPPLVLLLFFSCCLFFLCVFFYM